MALDRDALLAIIQKNEKITHMVILGQKYELYDSEFSYSDVPVSKPTTRGGVYFTDTMAFKVRARATDSTLSKILPKTMLGPNTEFAKIELIGNVPLKIFANLTNYVQKSSGFELNLMISDTES